MNWSLFILLQWENSLPLHIRQKPRYPFALLYIFGKIQITKTKVHKIRIIIIRKYKLGLLNKTTLDQHFRNYVTTALLEHWHWRRCLTSKNEAFVLLQISPLMTSEVYVSQSGHYIANRMVELCAKHYNLSSTCITGIPMKVNVFFIHCLCTKSNVVMY